ncbi:F-box protein SKIP3 [Glycine max]|nr:F-box protein SKIP3 [Glycine max]
MDITKVLPEECISMIVSFTSPEDACRLSLVSPFFKEIADSDAVWENFLPSDYKDIIDQSSTPSLNLFSKKQIYSHLSVHHVLLVNGNMSLYLEKATGKKCCMVSASGIEFRIRSSGSECYFSSEESVPQSSDKCYPCRFYQLVQIKFDYKLRVTGSNLDTKVLSPNTNYGVYFIFHLVDQDFQPRNLQWMLERAQRREDGWMEVEITDFFSGDGYNLVDFHYKLKNNDLRSYCCLIVEGVEFRPKNL